MLDGRPLADVLAAERPRWPPGRPGYHAVTAAVRPRAAGRDRVLSIGSAFGCALPSRAWRLGSPTAFGHPGIGGALGLGDPRRGRPWPSCR
ncbi:hypothetical protein [Nonomuraea sp. NPDC052265]|uniref:hypothetical protein n=1 Tax=Nonomuraea sp. NPDC052265 TaxID=3364374 RepID=UPI0037CB2A34